MRQEPTIYSATLQRFPRRSCLQHSRISFWWQPSQEVPSVTQVETKYFFVAVEKKTIGSLSSPAGEKDGLHGGHFS